MKNYLLYSNASSTTGKTLTEALKEKGAKIASGIKDPGSVEVMIRWGSTAAVAKNPGKVYNTKRAIVGASSKLSALAAMRDSGIRVPKLFGPNPVEIAPNDFPVLGRKDHHVAGNDIVLCLQRKDIGDAVKLGCTHFTKYIPAKTEFRVHVWGDSVIKVSEKILAEPERNKDPWIRNFDEGYIFASPKTLLSAQAKGMAIDAVSLFGLNFGAVDLLLGDDGLAYVLEVNTAPGLQTDSSIEVYVNKMMEVLK